MSRVPLHLMEHPENIAVVRLGPKEEPTWDWEGGPFWSLSRSAAETSVICLADRVPPEHTQEGPFRAVEVAGPLDFSLVGVLAEILEPLVRERVSAFALSTYDTDWILVPAGDTEVAAEAWRRAGLILTPSVITGSGS